MHWFRQRTFNRPAESDTASNDVLGQAATTITKHQSSRIGRAQRARRHVSNFTSLSALCGVFLVVFLAPALLFAQATVAPTPKFLGLDSNAHPLSGGKLCTYEAGSTTPKATYTSQSGAVANSNPVILDSSGRADVWLLSGQSYKLILRSAGTDSSCSTGSTQWTVDNIGGVPTTSGNTEVAGTAGEALTAGQVVYLSDGSGGQTPGSWYKADADFAYASTFPFIGIVPTSIASGTAGTIRLAGQATGLSSLIVGTTYYVSATAGSLTATAPANRRIVGVADSTSTLLLFPALPTGSTTSTITTTGTQTALALPSGTGALTIFANNATLLSLQGIAAGIDGQQLTIYAIGAGNVDLLDQNGSASAVNRIITGRGATLTLPSGAGSALLQYDGTATRWRVLAFMGTSTSTITTTGTQTALGIPTGMGALTIFANNATLLTLQGIAAGVDGQSLTIYSIGAGQVDLSNQDAAATATLRIINSVTGTISLAAGSGRVSLVYDGTTARWRVTSHEQGAWITPTFAAGNYTASAGNFTLASGDVQTQKYWLRGRALTVAFSLATTTVSATPTALYINNGAWGGFTVGANTMYAFLLYNDNGAGNAQGYLAALAADTKIQLTKNAGSWSAATDTSAFFGTVTFEVN